jgi:hypothetical protein
MLRHWHVSSEHEVAEEEFLERCVQTARELREEAKEDAEIGQDEDGHEIELGMLATRFTFVHQQLLQNFIII